MPLNFPSNPTANVTTYTDGTTTWLWTGLAWEVQPVAITANTVGLGNVTNESKETMFTDPVFTGTVSGITKSMVGLGNVTNESKATMFTSPTFTGTVAGITAAMVGLGNVTNESKATMFTSPTFTGTVSGVTAAMVGLGNVTNESKATMFANPTFTGTANVSNLSVSGTATGITKSMVGLGNVTNESKATMFTSPTFTGTVSGVTATMVGLGNVTNESKATMFTNSTLTGTTQITSLGIGTAASGTTGEIRATNEITAYYTSDISLKENIETIDLALEKLQKITGVMFDWKEEVILQRGGVDGFFVRKRDTGIIAQDVEQVLPEIVGTRPDGTKGVKYEKLAGLIIEAIKELHEQVKDLRKNKP